MVGVCAVAHLAAPAATPASHDICIARWVGDRQIAAVQRTSSAMHLEAPAALTPAPPLLFEQLGRCTLRPCVLCHAGTQRRMWELQVLELLELEARAHASGEITAFPVCYQFRHTWSWLLHAPVNGGARMHTSCECWSTHLYTVEHVGCVL